jgi:hypothetical protein
LFNYRYSTIGLVSQLGLVGDIGGVLNFQDFTFKMVFPTRRAGIFSVYGMGGKSSFEFEDVTPALWVVPGDNATQRETRNDFNKKAHLLNTGLRHTLHLGRRSFLNTTLTYANEGIEDDIFEAGVLRFYDGEGKFLRDSEGNLAVDVANNRVWDYSRAFEATLDMPYQIQVSASYKWNRRRTTHELFLNLDNLTNNKGRITEFYDETEPNNIGYQTQFGFFPNLMYRVYF